MVRYMWKDAGHRCASSGADSLRGVRSSHVLIFVTVTLILSDENFGKLTDQKANAQKLFMSGKLKVKGNVMKATKLEPILKKARPSAKL